MAGRRKPRAEEHEEHVNHERWLLTYADMITLLMVLFIVMFAMSTVDAKKFLELKESLAGAFGGSTSPVPGGASTGSDDDGVSPAPIDLQAGGSGGGTAAAGSLAATEAGAKSNEVTAEALAAAIRQADLTEAYGEAKAAEQEVEALHQLEQRMTEQLNAAGLAGSVQFTIDQRGLVVNIVTNSLVFGGDSAVLRTSGRQILRALGPTLASIPNQLEIAGHTNQLNVPTINYPSSWELSTARASSVVRYLVGPSGLQPNRMTATGYADQRPLVPPENPVSIVMNRRVEIIVLSDQPLEVRALLATVAAHP